MWSLLTELNCKSRRVADLFLTMANSIVGLSRPGTDSHQNTSSSTADDSHRSASRGQQSGYHVFVVRRFDYRRTMDLPAANEITDRNGNRLADPPSAEDISSQADLLLIVPDDELPQGALNRRPQDELENLRRQAIAR